MGVLAIITYPVGVPMLLLALCYIYRVPFYAKRKMDDHWLRAARSRSRRIRRSPACGVALSRLRPPRRVRRRSSSWRGTAISSSRRSETRAR